MVNNAAKRSGNRVEQSAQVELGNHGVVHFEQNAQAVALLRQLPLVGLRALEIQRVVHRHGHLPRHLLHECDFDFGIVVRRPATETQHAQAALRCGERNRTERPHAVLPQNLQQRRETRFFFRIVQNKRLLRFPDPTGRCLTHRKFGSGTNFPGFLGFQNMQAHDVARRVMQSQIEVIEFHDAVQARRQFMKQFSQVAMLRNGFRHFQKRLVLRLRRTSRQLPDGYITHSVEDNT